MIKKTVFLLWGWCALLCLQPSSLRARHTADSRPTLDYEEAKRRKPKLF